MSTFQTGETIAQAYRVVKRLGQGAFGAVYLIDHLHLPGRQFALKVLKTGFDEDEQRLQRFQREVNVLLDLIHASIVPVREFRHFDDICCYVMDYVEGPTLKRLLEEEGPLPVERALLRTREVLEALAYAHGEGVVHRDIKPENVIVAEAGGPRERSKVLDFGIAKLLDAAATGLTGGGPIGTAAYMSPEQARGKEGEVDGRADVYSVGCMLFELLTGRPPFVSESQVGYITQHAFEEVPAFAEAAPQTSFPPGVEELVRKALEKQPGGRFASAGEMIAALDALELVTPREPSSDRIPAPSVAIAASPSGRVVAAVAKRSCELARGRIELPEGADPGGLRTLFVLGGAQLRMGRARPEQQQGPPCNSLVLRVLPCRSGRLDPENYLATKQISSAHAVIELRDGVPWLADLSSFGTWIDHQRVPKRQPARLPGRFRLGLAQVLTLECALVPPEPTPAAPLQALLLRRAANQDHQAYLWVPGRVELGGGAPIEELRLGEAVAGSIEASGDMLAVKLPETVSVRPAAVGDEVRFEEAEAPA